jgi:hypothetical protein
MKNLLILCLCSAGLAMTLWGQTPAEPAAPAPAATASPVATAGVPPADLADKIQQRLEKKFRGHHGITIETGDHEEADRQSLHDLAALPIVAVVFLSIFGAPVLIVILIGLFTLLLSRMRQRTVRMMLEKGQPVPVELISPGVRAARPRSDVRRGVAWAMVGLGLMVWLGAVSGWEGGAWSFGLIPFLIGLGYLIVWKLEGKKDVPPPPPAP